MSDPVLPPAAHDVTDVATAMAGLSNGAHRAIRSMVTFGVALVLLILALWMLRAGAIIQDGLLAFAVGVAGTALLFAIIVVLPGRAAARRRRSGIDSLRALRSSEAEALRGHLASIGYAVPLEVASEWVTAEEPRGTVPLVHDSVIAARRWQPTATDTRIFVEPYLIRGDVASALPRLPPLARLSPPTE